MLVKFSLQTLIIKLILGSSDQNSIILAKKCEVHYRLKVEFVNEINPLLYNAMGAMHFSKGGGRQLLQINNQLSSPVEMVNNGHLQL